MEILGCHQRARGRWAPVALVVTSLLWSGSAAAESVTAPTLKAAFLYNFAKFAEWPASALAPGQRLSLCVVGDNAVAEALEQTIKGRGVDSHELTVEIVKADGPIRSCHLLYVSGLERKQAGQLLTSLKSTAVFAVSDADHFAEMGGVAQLIQDNGRMRFAVNIEAARRAQLKISSKLLSLAQIVKDDADAPH